ncbi:MAG: hypothetical protein ACYC3I_23530 [Gemmataceae bacterium]
MTIRMLIEAKKRRYVVVAILGIAIAIGGVILEELKILNMDVPLAALPGLAIFIFTLLYANFFAFRCPRCGGNWAVLAVQRYFFILDRRIRYCPYCGADIDNEIVEQQVQGEG